MTKVTARAHTNIAFIKYWGKKNQKLFLPYNNSLSLTLNEFYTDTTVEESNEDVFLLNDQIQNEQELKKIQQFLNIFRDLTGNQQKIKITSINHVPTAAGLASSSSAYAALSLALNKFYQLDLDYTTLSTFARRGSGSATRSLFGGFVEWQQGDNNDNSLAVKIDDANFDIGLLICVVNKQHKKISSRKGMQHTVETSPFYKEWVQTAPVDLENIKKAIQNRDVNRIGEIAEHNAMKMHATMLAANPPFTYFEPASLLIIQAVKQLRTKGYSCYYTMDAGPNVKIIAPFSELEEIKKQLSAQFNDLEMIISKPGPDAFLL